MAARRRHPPRADVPKSDAGAPPQREPLGRDARHLQREVLRQQEASLRASLLDSERMASLFRAQLDRCLERQGELAAGLEG